MAVTGAHMASDDSFEQPAPRRRLPRILLAAAALLVAGVIGLVARPDPGSPDPGSPGELAIDEDPPAAPETPEPEPAPESTVPGDDRPGADAELREAPGSWSGLSEAPLAPRRAAPVWTGSELVIWGGQRESRAQRPFYDDGAAFDPETGEWRALPPAPIGARGGHVAVWADGELLVWGGQDRVRFHDDGAAYDPVTDSWATIPPGPLSPRGQAVAGWVDGELVVVGGVDGAGFLTDAAAYDPGRGEWRALGDDVPVGLGSPQARSTVFSDRLVVWVPGGAEPGAPPTFRYYAPGDDRWGEIEPPGILSDVGPDQWITATDDALVAVSAQGPGGRPRMAIRDGPEWEDVIAPTGSRGPPGEMANPFSEAAVADGDRVYILDDAREPLRYDLTESTWRSLPGIDAATSRAHHLSQHYQAVPVGDGVLVWLGGVADSDAAGEGSPPGVVVWQPED